MFKVKKVFTTWTRIKFLTTLTAGIAAGILSQHIPELKSYTDEIIHPLNSHPVFKEWMNKIGVRFPSSHIPDEPIAYSDYSETEFRQLNHPNSTFTLHRSGYTVGYDARMRNPAWVYEHLTAENLEGDVDRSNFNFKEDEQIPKHLRATPASYKGQGLDQGHMAPAADHRSHPHRMEETFYLTNICPQCPQFNREYWSKLEKQVRDFTKDYPHVYVVTGPLYLPYQEGRRRFVKYQVIGPDEIAVPSHFFKVITLEDRHGNQSVRSYIVPNSVISPEIPLDKFRATIQKIERAAGILLFPRSANESMQ